jgi:UDP-N-acetylglucosamine diphosphorylase/glucosamine-1-phosphate N-acetyltransferase
MDIILFDTPARNNLFPLTLNKAVADLRFGILTIRERWQKLTGQNVFVLTEKYLQQLYPSIETGDVFLIDAAIVPTAELVRSISNLQLHESLFDEQGPIAARCLIQMVPTIDEIEALFLNRKTVSDVKRLLTAADIFLLNDEMIRFDFALVTKGRISHDTNDTVHIKKASQVFVEEGAEIDYSILNASTGPIYIGKNAVIMENCAIRGPFCLGEGATLKMGTRVYGATTVGPYCTGGGEIKNSVMMGYSNKGHDGYLGDSVIGEWCNLGAGTSNSNVKNTGGNVKLWSYSKQDYVPVGMKCGVIMGDYSRTAINTSINTGTVIGMSCNVVGSGLTPKLIRDFSWGTEGETYDFEKAVKDINNWKEMKNKTLSEPETQVLKHIFEAGKK